MMVESIRVHVLIFVVILQAVCTSLSAQEVIICNTTVLRVNPNLALNYTDAKDACITKDESLASSSDLDDIVRCTNGSLVLTTYWLSDTIASRSSRVETIKQDNTYIHVVREKLTQQNADSGCKRLFEGSLFTMVTPKELFLTIKPLKIEGIFWLQDVKESNESDDCLVLAKLKGKSSLRAVNCDEDHFSICQSVADPSLLLNSAFFEEILMELVLHKNDTGKDFRAKNSIWDSRESAQIVGGSGIVFMAIFAVIVGLCDLPYLKFCVGCAFDRIAGMTRDRF